MSKDLKNILLIGGLVAGIGYFIQKREPSSAWFSRQWKSLGHFDRKHSLAIFIPKLKK